MSALRHGWLILESSVAVGAETSNDARNHNDQDDANDEADEEEDSCHEWLH